MTAVTIRRADGVLTVQDMGRPGHLAQGLSRGGAMDRLGYATQSSLAQAIGVDRSTVSLWLEGRIGVPRPVAKLVRLLLVHESTTGRVAP